MIVPGMNGRFFPANHRPALQEIDFAARVGFRALQFQGWEKGLSEIDLGASFFDVAQGLKKSCILPVMEMVIRLDRNGLTAAGKTPIEILQGNIASIEGLGCERVHWHLVPREPMDAAACRELERTLVPALVQAVALGREHKFVFGFEHNEPDLGLFSSPEACEAAIDSVSDLHFVWDFNHTMLTQLDGFLRLVPRMSLLHVSDSPLPEVNHHLPLGLGTIDYSSYVTCVIERGYSGPAILEIGGLPKSGGYGRDTDEALIDSLARLNGCLAT